MDDRVAANRASWDARTPVHVASRFYDVDGWVRDRPLPRQRELDVIGDVTDRTLVHLQCHIGLDTLQLARAGARAVGLDFSPAAIDTARSLAQQTALADRAEFVCADVYDAVEALSGRTFDVVYVSLGALCWLPSVERWAEQAAALVAPGGRLYLHDVHPMCWALDDDEPRVAHTYFQEPEPYVDDAGTTYTDGVTDPLPRSYEWNHSIGEIVTAVLGQGLVVEQLVEHDWGPFSRFPFLVELPFPPQPVDAPRVERRWTTPPGAPRIPLSFTLLASLRAR